MTSISFIIPTRNESRYIARCLDAIISNMLGLGQESYEVLVMDNQSTDGTPNIVREYTKKYPNFRLFPDFPAEINISELRNLTADEAVGELFVFIDGDVVLADDWYITFSNAISVIENNPKTIVGRTYGYAPESSWVTKDWYEPELATGASSYIPAGHMIMTQDRFYELNGFDVNLETGEDVDICRRCRADGGNVLSASGMDTYHLGYPNTLKDFFNRERWHGKGNWFPFSKVGKTNMSRLLVINLVAYTVSLLLIFNAPVLLLWAVVLTLASATVLGLRRAKGMGKYIPSCIFLSGVQLYARFMSLVDVLRTKDSYLLRKG